MSFCQPIAAMTLPAVPLAFGYYLQPRIFSFTSNLLSVSVFSFLLYRLWLGYKLALTGAYNEYTSETSGSKQRQTIAAASSPLIRPMLTAEAATTSSPSSSFTPAPMLHFPLVFPLYYKYLLVLLSLLSLQLLLSLFAPNSPSYGPAVFLLSMLVYTCFHACEQGLLTFLTQRSIGSGAIRRSILWGAAWGIVVLLAVVIAADLDRQRDGTAASNTGQQGNSSAPTGVLPRLRGAPRGVTQAAAWRLPASPLTAHVDGNVSGAFASVVSGSDDWRGGSWFDVSGSVLVVDTATADLRYTYLAAALCDCCLLLYYLLLLIIRIRCLRIMPWLSSRVSAFSLARFLFLRRLLSLLSLLLFLLTASSASTYCLNIALQAYMPVYGVGFYLFLVWDSRFWRKLEYITNGPYPAYRSLDDTGRRGSEGKGAADDAAAASCTSSPLASGDAASSASASASTSIAPLLKLPRHGLPNLVPILHHHMVDFSELSISSSQPLALGRPDTAVYAALYRGQPVAVKRLHCDVLTVELIEREVGEARLMSVLHHRYVVRFIGVCIRPPCVCLVSELCEGGSLSEWVQQRRREMEEEEEEQRQQKEEDDDDLSITVDRSRTAAGLAVPEAAIAEESDSCDETAAQQASSSSFLSFSLDLSSSSSFPLSTILSFALDACCALTYLHSFSPPIIHRDIKSSNFVLAPVAPSPPSPTSSLSSASISAASSSPQYRLLLIDFGESRRFHWLEAGLERRREERGTISWMAPELLRDVKVAEHVRAVLGGEAEKKERLSEAELHRLLQSVGVTAEEAEVECWREGKDNEEEWDEIIQATLSLSSASFASNSSSLISSSAPSPSGAANALSASFSSSPSSSRFSSSSSSSSFLSRSFFASSSRYSEKVDIYGLSMLLWSMLALRPHPFARIPSFLLPFLVTRGVRPRCPAHTPPLLMRLMRAAWHPDPRRRPSAMQLMDRLECVQYQLAGSRGEEVLREQLDRRKDVGGGENGGRGKPGRPGREREAERERERAERERDWERERTQSPPIGRRRTPQPQRALSSYGLPPLMSPSASPSSQSATVGLPAFVTSASAPGSQSALTSMMLSSPTATPRAAARAADMRIIEKEPGDVEETGDEETADGAAHTVADDSVEHKLDWQQLGMQLVQEVGTEADADAAAAASPDDTVEYKTQ